MLKIRMIALVVVVAMLLSIASITSAQAGAYVKTFDLPTKPTTDGAYAGVDPTGAKVTFWHAQSGVNAAAIKSLADAFNAGNPWKITVTTVAKGGYPDVENAMIAALQTK